MVKQNNHLGDIAENSGYGIGAVSSLTGISPDTLRVWEKRYAIVQPKRTPSGNRVYSQEDLNHLLIIKRLLDAGDSIGHLVKLDIASLKDRAATLTRSSRQAEPLRPCRAVVMGLNMATRLAETREELDNIEVMGTCASLDEIAELHLEGQPDVVIVELPTLTELHFDKLIHWREQLKAAYVVVIYRFSNNKILRQITSSRCIPLRAPIEMATLQRYCEAIVRQLQADITSTELDLPALGEPLPPRLYDDETLAHMANISSTIKCECPHHLAEIIMALNAFETYSTECENQSSQDASLHAYLHHATAEARHKIEKALEHVIQVEQIKT